MTTTTDHDVTLHHFDLRGRVRVQLLTYVNMSGWKVSIVLLSANALWDMFAVKKDVSVRIFWHTSPWLCAVSSIIFHWFTQCDVSLQNCINNGNNGNFPPRRVHVCQKLHVVVSLLRDQSFFVVSRGQSTWSFVLRGWCLYSMVVMHTYLLRHMAGENRGQCLDKCTNTCRWSRHSTETEAECRLLLSYLLLLLLLNVY